MQLQSRQCLSCLFVLVSTGLTVSSQPPAYSQSCNYYAGKAVGGEDVNIDLCSIARQDNRQVEFVYSLGGERIQSKANCLAQTWTTFPEGTVHRPQSKTTQDMLKIVCTAPSFNPGIAIGVVFDPPSNIRTSPNGGVLCTIRDIRAIAVFGGVTEDGWTHTDACGRTGFIHKSQIRYR